jgi:hypothetical protein
MSSDPKALRAIEEAAGYVRDTIKHFTDDERKQILDGALRELDSRLVVVLDGSSAYQELRSPRLGPLVD